MRGETAALVGWASLLAVLDAALWVASASRLAGLLLALPVLATLAAAVMMARRQPARARFAVRDVSFSAVVIAVGGAVVAAGLVIGAWLALVGAGLIGLGVVGALRETRPDTDPER